MKEKTVFHEYQQMSMLRRLFIIAFASAGIAINAFDNFYTILVSLIIGVIVCCFLFFAVLETVIDESGIDVRLGMKYVPFNFKHEYFSWEDVEEVRIGEYKTSIKGIRLKVFSFRRHSMYNTAFTREENIGLHIVLKNRRELFISTNEPDTLTNVLRESGKLNEQV
jgi:hypothetical protein